MSKVIPEGWWVIRYVNKDQWQWTPNRGKRWYTISPYKVEPRRVRDLLYHLFNTGQIKHLFCLMEYDYRRRELYLYLDKQPKVSGAQNKSGNIQTFFDPSKRPPQNDGNAEGRKGDIKNV